MARQRFQIFSNTIEVSGQPDGFGLAPALRGSQGIYCSQP
jgi:hypothetical protein